MDYFPLGIAQKTAFCNRKSELTKLVENLKQSRPTLITAPRRYGKSSLALNAIDQSGFAYGQFDFFSAIDEKDIERIILNGVGKLISRLEPIPKKALNVASELFSGLSIKLALDKIGVSIEINKHNKRPDANILDILERVEALSKKYNRKVVLYFDEFQRLYEISDNIAIEGILRQIAQSSQYLSFMFLGSNRHLLSKIFNDRNRPFYKLCDRITLERISKKAYEEYILSAATNDKKAIDNDALEQIFNLTERHPYYVNLLCSRIWQLKSITSETVLFAWEDYIAEERSNIGAELDLLSKNQKKLLILLARYNGTYTPRSAEFLQKTGMAGASVTQALKFLEQMDYVYVDAEGLTTIIDPLLKAVLIM